MKREEIEKILIDWFHSDSENATHLAELLRVAFQQSTLTLDSKIKDGEIVKPVEEMTFNPNGS